ncbi:EF-hand domain-containing protein [Roseibium marinum]|uniref:EF hand domain-containing protein n=1 Tax=Roseibium marinum TaxID=281252 RepID=A0A2S3UM29_9HYPH|nr:calcium-binding protein [Roseibium marinum]POF28778.1 EF hand domain-containing protein [Roseibium marinum]
MKTSVFAIAALMSLTGVPSVLAGEGPGAHFIENWDLDSDGEVTVEEARLRRSDVFASFDANDDGYLDAEEYELFDEARALDMAENEPAGMGRGARNPANGMRLEVNDNDGDGKVSQAEFLDNAPDWIMKIDRNGDGVVSLADFGPGKN